MFSAAPLTSEPVSFLVFSFFRMDIFRDSLDCVFLSASSHFSAFLGILSLFSLFFELDRFCNRPESFLGAKGKREIFIFEGDIGKNLERKD